MPHDVEFHRPAAGRRDRSGRTRGGKLLIWRRLERDGSHGAVRSPGPGSPGPPRSETSARGRLLGKGRLLEPRSPSGQNARLRSGIAKETEGVPLVSPRHSRRQYPLHPYTRRDRSHGSAARLPGRSPLVYALRAPSEGGTRTYEREPPERDADSPPIIPEAVAASLIRRSERRCICAKLLARKGGSHGTDRAHIPHPHHSRERPDPKGADRRFLGTGLLRRPRRDQEFLQGRA